MWQHLLGNFLLLSVLSLATGKVLWPRNLKSMLAPSVNVELNTIGSVLLEKIRETYGREVFFDKVNKCSKSVYLRAIFGTLAVSGKISLLQTQHPMDLLSHHQAKIYSTGHDIVDLHASVHVQDILDYTDKDDQSEDVKGIMSKFEYIFPNLNFATLPLRDRVSNIDFQMMTDEKTVTVQFSGSILSVNWFDAKNPYSYLVVTFYSYETNEPKTIVPPNMVDNLLKDINDRRNENFYPVFMSTSKHNVAQLYGVSLGILSAYSKNTAATKSVVTKRKSFRNFIPFMRKSKNSIQLQTYDHIDEANETDSDQSLECNMSVSIAGPGQSLIIFVGLADDDDKNRDVDVLDVLTKSHSNAQQSKLTPTELLLRLQQRTGPVHPSLYLKLIFTTPTLEIGVVHKNDMFIFVFYTTFNPLLTSDWKFSMSTSLNSKLQQLPDDKYMDVKDIMEPRLKEFVNTNNDTAMHTLGVVSNLPNIWEKGPSVLICKYEYSSPEIPLVDDRAMECEFVFKKGQPVINSVLNTTLKDILRNRFTPPPNETMPIWKIWNGITFHETDTPSSDAFANLVSLNTEKVTYTVLALDDFSKKDKIAFVSVFLCHKGPSECDLRNTESDEQLLSKFSSIRKSKHCDPFIQSESTLAQEVANVMRYIPVDKYNMSSLDPMTYAGLLKHVESFLVFLIINNDQLFESSAVVDYTVDHILKSTKYKHITAMSPAKLNEVPQGFHQPSSFADPWLVANSLTLAFGISTHGNLKFVVIEVILPPEKTTWGFGRELFTKMINNARESAGAKPFSMEPALIPATVGLARILLDALKSQVSDSTSRRYGSGVFFPPEEDLKNGSSSSVTNSSYVFSFTLDPCCTLRPDSTLQQQNDQIELLVMTHIQNILTEKKERGFNNVRIEWKNENILIMEEAVETSRFDFFQVTSDNWTGYDYDYYIMEGPNNTLLILSVLVYNGLQLSRNVSNRTTDQSVYVFINELKSAQLFRTVEISREKSLKEGKVTEALSYLIQNNLKKPNGPVESSGIIPTNQSFYIFINMLGKDLSIDTVLRNITELWNTDSVMERKLSPSELSELELGKISWGYPSTQFSLVSAFNTISYMHVATAYGSTLLLHGTLPKTLSSNWSTPLDSIRTTLDDLIKRLRKAPVDILTTPTKSQMKAFMKLTKHVEGKPVGSSGVASHNLIAMSFLSIEQDPTQPQNVTHPVLCFGKALTNVVKHEVSNNVTNPTRQPFPDGTSTDVVTLWDTTSFLDLALLTQVGIQITIITSSLKDSKGNYRDAVYIFCPIPGTQEKPLHTNLTRDMINAYLVLNKLPACIIEQSLSSEVPKELTEYGKVVKCNLQHDGFALMYRIPVAFLQNLHVELVLLVAFQTVFEAALDLNLLSHLHKILYGSRQDAVSKGYTCYFVSEGKAVIGCESRTFLRG